MTSARLPFAADHEAEVALVGGAIAAVASGTLLAGLFVAWYRYPAFCLAGSCSQASRSGWSSLGGGAGLLAATAVAGALPLGGVLAGRGLRPACLLATAAGLGAALLVVFRLAVVPDAIPGAVYPRLAGPFIALLGAAGIAGGSALAGLGPGFFEPARRAPPLLSAILAASVVVIASLFMPWERYAFYVDTRVAGGRSFTATAWHAAPTAAVLLLLGSLAIMLAASLLAVIRWRSSFFAVGVGGWILAALAFVASPLSTATPHLAPGLPRMAGYQPGYYLGLAAAGVIALAGVYGAVDEPERLVAPQGPA